MKGTEEEVGGEQEADHREEVLLQLALLQTGLTNKSKRPPLEGKKKKKNKETKIAARERRKEERQTSRL